MKVAYQLAALFLGSVVVATPMIYPKVVLANGSISQTAQAVTVFIQGINNPDNFGSGVIIERSGGSYSVLTAAHVVSGTDRFTVKTNDGLQYSVQNIQRLPNLDLAIVQFQSSSSYSTAKLGNSDVVQQTSTVFVAGYPKPGYNITVPIFTITDGRVASLVKQGARDGYGLAYSNPTRAGMSGGPVFNEAGEVVAIHGRKEGELDGSAPTGAWVNLGIPINYYKSAGSSVALAAQQKAAQEEAQRQAQLAAQQKAAQEEAQRQAQLAAQQKAAQEEAQRQAQLAAQQKAAQEEAQRQAQLAAQQKAAQEEAQRQAQLAAQQKAAQEEAQRQAQLAAQQKAAQEEAQRQSEAQQIAAELQETRRQAQLQAERAAEIDRKLATAGGQTSTANLLATTQPFTVTIPKAAATPSTKQVCKQIRINTIVTERCTTVAVDQLQEATGTQATSSPEFYISKGNRALSGGDAASAVGDYAAAIRVNPNSAIAYFNRGLAHLKGGQQSQAMADFTKAADLFRSQGDRAKLAQTESILQTLRQTQS